MRVEELTAYEVIEKREIKDINSMTYLCRHKKTGAKVALVSNDDDNKVFYIGFRTTPRDSTGVAHILEHSVLCGSREFPIKDPFIELAKGSLNTFLNAMTYPDHTVYPVASCNDQDFQNLMHVYLDAVFYPNIYGNEAIFRQEGWHYELDEAGELTYNGVVYNEMKGAFSSPDNVLYREISTALYPHTTYGYESGGAPDTIPELSYEQFLDFHRTYYHPSNSYIYLYGNMDMAEKLAFIDEHYLSAFDALEVDSVVASEAPFAVPVRRVREFPVGEGESAEENTYLAWSLSVGDTLDRELYVAFKILDFALCTVPGAPLKKALIEKGIGRDVYSIYDNDLKQPYFSVVAKGTAVSREQEFLDTIREVLGEIVRKGFDRKALLAAINHYEFKYREADFGSYPKGLMYGLQVMGSWMYDDGKPFIHIEANETYAKLRAKVEEGYFEKLIDRWLLNNPHAAMVILQPKEGLAKAQEKALADRLAEIKSRMSQEEIADVHSMMDALDAFRETGDAPEDLAKIPLLTREDMKKKAEPLINQERTLAGVPALYHNVFTNGIGYLRLMFKVQDIPGDYFPYIGILQNVFSRVDTAHYSYAELCNEINLATGEIVVSCNSYANVQKPEQYTITLEVGTKALYANLERAMELMEELILTSDFTDTKRLKEILAEGNSRYQEYMLEAGHSVALTRALSYGDVKYAVSDELTGVAQYRLTSGLEKAFEQKKESLTERLETLCRMIFRPENLMVDFTGDEQAFENLEASVAALKDKLYTCEVKQESYVPGISRKNEGFMTSGQVQYVCRAGNFRKKGLPYKGTLKVLSVMMGYEYLWTNIRVKGGAYGCMCGFGRMGDCYFVSYRDPNLGQTIHVYENAADFIARYDADERTMTQYIIGTFSQLDIPLTAAAKGRRSREAYMRGITLDMIQRERDEIIAAQPEDIRGLAEYIRAFMEEDCLCVVGSEQKIKAEADKFMKIENLF
ncbi:insulinase family protein [Acetatifactor muris]|uniref:Peptidase M16C associated n=1 Tax=Acetatifactor muris TaxID=879566 RepID=A0A2K4ZLY3_9FIRM|nr:insulinase family protein [Acetatifactor muris]MCR2049708.1 insulinase family protein [Acetatifactor muris]SOY31488.1 Peptidase M16C associated [Acetatifactor muris]